MLGRMIKWLGLVIKLVCALTFCRFKPALLLRFRDRIRRQLVNNLRIVWPVRAWSLFLALLLIFGIEELFRPPNNCWLPLGPHGINIWRVTHIIDLLIIQRASLNRILNAPGSLHLGLWSPEFLHSEMYLFSKMVLEKF